VRREHDARDRRAWRVHLTKAVEPAMHTLRDVAAGLRRDALVGLSAAQRESFVDALIAIKANLQRLENGNGAARPAARRKGT
jgi:DNA-binding MarR family transcriptional regulator